MATNTNKLSWTIKVTSYHLKFNTRFYYIIFFNNLVISLVRGD